MSMNEKTSQAFALSLDEKPADVHVDAVPRQEQDHQERETAGSGDDSPWLSRDMSTDFPLDRSPIGRI